MSDNLHPIPPGCVETDDMILHLHEQAMSKENTPESKAALVFIKLMLSAFTEALDEAEKVLDNDRRKVVANIPVWFGLMYASITVPLLVNPEAGPTLMAMASLRFQDTVMNAAKDFIKEREEETKQ